MEQKTGRYRWEDEIAKMWRVQYVDAYSDQSAVMYIDKKEVETEDTARERAEAHDFVGRIVDIREIEVKVEAV